MAYPYRIVSRRTRTALRMQDDSGAPSPLAPSVTPPSPGLGLVQPAPAAQAPSPQTGAPPTSAQGTALQDYIGRVIRLIPADIVALYLGLHGVIASAAGNDPSAGAALPWLPWLMLCLTLYARAWGSRDPSGSWASVQWSGVLISVISFAVWVLNLGHPVALLPAIKPWLGSTVLLIWTFLVPRLYHGDGDV